MRSRAAVLVFFCFLLGVGAAATVAYKLGFVTPSAPTVTREHQIALAHAALIHQQWEAPPGDNVRDLTTDGLARWPNDLELLRVRALACDEIIRVAREAYHAGDLANALHLMKLAHELDPSDEDASRLAGEWQTELDDAPSMAQLAAVDAGAPPAASAKPKSISVSVDIVPPHPRAGQPVDFVARIVVSPVGAARPQLDKPVFQVSGPGVLNGARVAAACDEVGLCRASYSLASSGRIEVTFVAKAGAQPLRAARSVQVAGDASNAPAPPPSAADPMTGPAPSGSTGKWL